MLISKFLTSFFSVDISYLWGDRCWKINKNYPLPYEALVVRLYLVFNLR